MAANGSLLSMAAQSSPTPPTPPTSRIQLIKRYVATHGAKAAISLVINKGRGRATRAYAAVRTWRSRPVPRRLGLCAALLVVALAGVVLGVLLGGRTHSMVGPFEAEFSVTPSLSGGSDLQIPPLGSISVRSHDGPAHLSIGLGALDTARTNELITNPDGVARASNGAVGDITRGVTRLVIQSTVAALLGALLLAALVFRSVRRVALCGGLALAIMATSYGVAFGTFRRQSLGEPRYEGLLTNAGVVVGDARRIVDQYGAYRDQLQRMITNVSKLYTTMSTLPVYEPPDDTIRVLHVSDLHLNPSAWSVVRTVVQQFNIDVIIDTGDITDWGSNPETSYVNAIGTLGVPYVFIRGNHDSTRTAEAVAKQKNAIVLENAVTTVAGLRIAGIGDPRFTPDKSDPANVTADPQLNAGLRLVGTTLARTIAAESAPVDIALIHDPTMADPLAGSVPLVLAGHTHHREVRDLAVTPPSQATRTQLFVEGSTGGAGLRGLEGEEALPLELSVLYFGQDRSLQAWDTISVGGTGQSQVALERHLATSVAPAAGEVTPR